MENMIERKNPEHYNDPTPYAAMKNIEKESEALPERIIRRGDMYWCYHEAAKRDLPALIVSNDVGNKHSGRVIVVYCSNNERSEKPTHAPVAVFQQSVARCEAIHTLDKTDVHSYIRKATQSEMEGVDEALAVSIGLEEIHKEAAPVAIVEKVVEKEGPSRAEIERDLYKQLYQELLAKMMKEGR